MSGPRRVGLLGGTFDPPHTAHLVVAEMARVALHLAEVQFVVAGAPWMKETCSSAQHRVRMVQLAIGDRQPFVVNRREIDREGPTYTVDTLQELTAEAPDLNLYFLVGADAVEKLPKWHEVDKCLELATFVAFNRPDFPVELEGPILGRVRWLEVPAIGISSTDLRQRFAAGQAVRYQLPAAVEAYVRVHGLYGAAPEGP